MLVLSEMKDQGLSIDSKAWYNIISAQAHLNDLEAAVNTLHAMKSAGHIPGRYHMSLLIDVWMLCYY